MMVFNSSLCATRTHNLFGDTISIADSGTGDPTSIKASVRYVNNADFNLLKAGLRPAVDVLVVCDQDVSSAVHEREATWDDKKFIIVNPEPNKTHRKFTMKFTGKTFTLSDV